MAYGIKLLVWGERACFTRPEMKVERVSYDVITPRRPEAFWRLSIGSLLFAGISIGFRYSSRFGLSPFAAMKLAESYRPGK